MKVLVFKVNQLGDNVIFLPVVQELCRQLGRERVHVLTTPLAGVLYEGLLPEGNVELIKRDEFNGAWKAPGRMWRLLRMVRRLRPEVALVPFDQGNVARFLARGCGAKARIGVDSERVKTNGMSNHRITCDLAAPMAKTDWGVMRKAAEFMGEAGPVGDDPPPPDLAHLLGTGHQRIPRRVMIHPGASRPYKMWLPERFESLANQLVAEGYEVLWCEEGEAPGLDPAVQILGKGGLKEFIQAMATCGLFVGNNSGPMNLANALEIPSVIFSGPSPQKWDPFWHREKMVNLRIPELACQPCDAVSGPVNECRNGAEPMACMKRWSVEQVKDTVVELWQRCHGGDQVPLNTN